MSRSSILKVDAALLVLMWVGAFMSYAALPERFPIHFDLAGNADGWAERGAEGFVMWMLLPVVATLVSLLMRWAPGAARTSPSLWNIPRKREFLALDPDRRAPVHELMADSMAALTLLTTALLAVLQGTVFMAARSGAASSLIVVVLFLFSFAAFAIAIRSSRRARAAIDRAIDQKE